MFIALGLTFLGMALGFLLRGQPWITSLTRGVTPAIMLLLFALGISVGSNEMLMQSPLTGKPDDATCAKPESKA